MVVLSSSALVLLALIILVFFYLAGKFLFEFRTQQQDLGRTLRYFMDDQNFPTACWVIDMNGLVVFSNRAAVDTVFATVGEPNPIGKKMQHIFSTEIADKLKSLEIKAYNSSPRVKMAVIDFPAQSMYVINALVMDKSGSPLIQTFALPMGAMTEIPTI